MNKARILIAGGYGAVGQEVVKLISQRSDMTAVVGGRNRDKARKCAEQFDCEWQVMDLDDLESIKVNLHSIDIVINAFIPSDAYHVDLAEMAIGAGTHYLDVNAFIGYSERVMKLDPVAKEKDVTLITALGAYPGIPALLIADAMHHFSEIKSSNIYFAMGGKLEGMTPLAISGLDYMMNVTPMKWKDDHWENAEMKGTSEIMGEPFNKKIGFFPGMITYDLLKIPDMVKIEQIANWSGMENALQGMILYFGVKLGLGKNEKRAKKFLGLLKFLGKSMRYHPDTALKIVVDGIQDGTQKKRTIELHHTEDYLTALIPVLACEQLIGGQIEKRGAFTGPQVFDTGALIDGLKDSLVAYHEEWT